MHSLSGTMQQIVIQTLLLVAAAVTFCYTDQSFRKCHAFSGEDANINLERAVQIYKNCFITNIENFRHQVAGGTSCWNSTSNIIKCGDNVVRTIEECKSSDEQDFNKDIFKVISGYVEYICSNAINYKFSVLLDHKICFPSLAHAIGCFEKYNFFSSEAIVPKIAMCQDEQDVKDCLLDYINNTCIDDPVLHKYVNDVFSFDKPPCGKNSANTVYNSMLVVVLTIIVLSILL